jgi:N-methylhydantoinase A/oxoprolinase/acetone carboxylase beta subunit
VSTLVSQCILNEGRDGETKNSSIGGTNTDAVILHPHESQQSHRGIRGAFKTPTTPDVTEGIRLAVQGAIKESGIDRETISSVMIGTTVRSFPGTQVM